MQWFFLPDFNLFDATLKEEYGYGLFENVITSVDFEKLNKAGKGA